MSADYAVVYCASFMLRADVFSLFWGGRDYYGAAELGVLCWRDLPCFALLRGSLKASSERENFEMHENLREKFFNGINVLSDE